MMSKINHAAQKGKVLHKIRIEESEKVKIFDQFISTIKNLLDK